MSKVLKTKPGQPNPRGVSPLGNGLNFAFYSSTKQASLVFLSSKSLIGEVALDPQIHRTGDIWHIEIEGLPPSFDYGIKVGKEVYIDPYAQHLNTLSIWGSPLKPLGRYHPSKPFDWEGDSPPHLPFQDLIIYEMHVRGFTQDSSSDTQHPGTFLGMIDKIPYLKKLGINAVELMPVF